MAELDFECLGAQPDRSAAAPTIALRLRITESSSQPVHAIALRCQLRIEPIRRHYDESEASALRDLFGERARWGETLKPMQLAFVSHTVPSFTDSIEIDLLLPCSYDFDVAANKYLYALADGEVPLLMLFNGTVFTTGSNGFSVAPVPWHKQARFRLPVPVWRQAMQLHFPGTAWLRLAEDTFGALYRYRVAHDQLSWDEAIQRLLKEAGE